MREISNADYISTYFTDLGEYRGVSGPLTEGKGVVLIPSIRPLNLMGKYSHIYNLGQNPILEMRKLADYLEINNISEVAYVINQDAFGETYHKGLEQSFSGKVISFGHPHSEIDYRETITKIKNNDFQAMILSLDPTQTNIFLKQAKDLDLELPTFMNWLGGSEILFETGLADGIIFTYPFKKSHEFENKYKEFEENGIPLHPLNLNSYDSIKLFADAMMECGENDLSCIQDYFQTSNKSGVGGTFTFENNMANREIFLKQIKNREFVYLN